jgi:hypothetical protein
MTTTNVPQMRLHLDHLIIRAQDPADTMAELIRRARAGASVPSEVEDIGPVESGIIRAGSVDIEALKIGREPPPQAHGYGIGFVADAPLRQAVATLRELGFVDSTPVRGVDGTRTQRRTWRAAQLRGLLPNPFPAPASTRTPGIIDRAIGAGAGALGRIPAVARAATREAGESMVVVTECHFDATARRPEFHADPQVIAGHAGTAGRPAACKRLPLAADTPLHLQDGGPRGINRLLAGRPAAGSRAFSIAGVRFEFAP